MKKTKIIIFNRQGNTIKKSFYYREIASFEIASQYVYLGFRFVPSGKKYVGIENLIRKLKKIWLSIQKMLSKSKIDTKTKMFQYFQRFPFIETNRYLFKAFKEKEFDAKAWVQGLKYLLDMIGLD